jgi:hypothetical protein
MGGGIASGNNASVTQAKLVRTCRSTTYTNLPTNPTNTYQGSDIALGGTIFQLGMRDHPLVIQGDGCSTILTSGHRRVLCFGSRVPPPLQVGQPSASIRTCARPSPPWQDGEGSEVHASRDVCHDGFHSYSVLLFFLPLFCFRGPSLRMACRTIYRVIEFEDGWNGKVNSTQWFFSKSWSFFAAPSLRWESYRSIN